jgi:O-antigen/teichoic acid export membrane protein
MLARKSVFVLVADIANALLSYIALYFIARFMNPGAYGVIVFATSYVALMTIYGDLGFDSAHVKYISSGEDQAQCTSVYVVVKSILTVVGIVSVLLSIIVWKFALTKGYETPENELVIYLILASTMVRGFAGPFLGVFTAQREMAKYKLTLLFGTVARLAGVVYVGLVHLGIIAFSLVFVAEAVAVLGFSIVFFFRNHKLTIPTKKYFKMYSSFAFPMAFAGFFSIAITSFSPVLIQLCFSSTDVGYYSAALRIVGVLGIFTGAIGTLLFPTLSSLHANGDTKGMCSLISDSERYLGMISFPLVFGTMALAIPIVYIGLAGWMPAAIILQALPLYLLFSAIEQPYSGQLLGSNNPHLMRNRMFIAFCINIGLNILLVPKILFGTHLAGLGGFGAAIALIASSFAGWFYCRRMSQKILPGIKFNKHLIVHFAAAGAMALIVYYMTTVFPIVRWYELGIIAGVYFGGYLGILVLFREFTKKDFDLIWKAVDPRKLYSYAKDEVKGK